MAVEEKVSRPGGTRPPPPVQISMLGRFHVQCGDREVPARGWGRRGGPTLLKLLALHPRRSLHRAEIIDTLWLHSRPGSAEVALRQALHAARRALEPHLDPRAPSSYVHLDGDVVRLDASVVIDAHEFRRLGAEALLSGDQAAIEAALALYRGDLLPEDRYDDWFEPYRRELRQLYVDLLLHLADILERRGADGAAVERLRAALERDPAREEAHRRLMSILARTGHRRLALEQYAACRTELQRHKGVVPGADTEAVRRAVLATQPSGAPGDIAADVLPLPATVLQEIERAPDFVDREDIVEDLLGALERAAASRGEGILVFGPAGVGKTRLAATLARLAHRDGALVLWGASHAGEGRPTFGPFAEALEAYALSQPDDVKHNLITGYPRLAALAPTLHRLQHGAGRAPPLASDVPNADTSATIEALLSDLATPRTVVLVLDDMHESDDASLQLLLRLARLAIERRWLILATARESELQDDTPVSQTLRTLVDRGALRGIYVARLPREDCDRLVEILLRRQLEADGRPGPHDVEPLALQRIFEMSQGSPLVVIELVHSLVTEQHLVPVDSRWRLVTGGEVAVPARVRELVAQRVERFPANTRHVLALAAVLGAEFSFERLAAAAARIGPAISSLELADILDRALQAQILRETQAPAPLGSVFHFGHPMARTAIYEHMPAYHRSLLHRAVAEALEAEAEPDVAALAYHYAQTPDRHKTAGYLEAAGDRALALYALNDAADHYRRLLKLLAGDGAALDVARVRRKLGEVLLRTARYAEGASQLEASHAAYVGARDHDGALAALLDIGRNHLHWGSAETGLARLESAGERLIAGASRLTRVRFMVVKAALLWALGRYDEQLALAESAGGLLSQDDPSLPRALTTLWRGIALVALDRLDEGIAVLEESIPLAEACGAQYSVSRAFNTLAIAHEQRGDMDRVRSCLERALAAAERTGDPTRTAFMTFRLGWHASITGDWPTARHLLRRARARDDDIGLSSVSALIRFGLGTQHVLDGDWSGAAQRLHEALRLAERSDNPQIRWAADLMLAELDLKTERPDAARERLAPLLQLTALSQADRVTVLARLARAHLALGDGERAGTCAAEAEARAQPIANTHAALEAHLAAGQVHFAAGNWAATEQALQRTLDLARRLSNPYMEALATYVLGRMNAARGKFDPGQQQLEHALAVFRRLGAPYEVERAQHALAALLARKLV